MAHGIFSHAFLAEYIMSGNLLRVLFNSSSSSLRTNPLRIAGVSPVIWVPLFPGFSLEFWILREWHKGDLVIIRGGCGIENPVAEDWCLGVGESSSYRQVSSADGACIPSRPCLWQDLDSALPSLAPAWVCSTNPPVLSLNFQKKILFLLKLSTDLCSLQIKTTT